MINKSFISTILLVAFVLFLGCRKEKEDKEEEQEEQTVTEYTASYGRSDIQISDLFELKDSNKVTYFLEESSGIVSSRRNENMVYIHEDSGNRAVVFVYNYEGKFLGELILIGIQNRDWEDIAIGPGPEEGRTYIYIADFGDNNQAREELRIHRFEEPQLTADTANPFKVQITNVETILYRYPDGSRDAETLLLNPLNKSLIIVTKRDPRVRVYELPFPQPIGEVVNPIFRGVLPFRTMVGGDISPDGQHILIKTYGEVYYWQTENNDPLKTLFNQKPLQVEYFPEVQGEAIGWENGSNAYFTISETDNGRAEPILFKYTRK